MYLKNLFRFKIMALILVVILIVVILMSYYAFAVAEEKYSTKEKNKQKKVQAKVSTKTKDNGVYLQFDISVNGTALTAILTPASGVTYENKLQICQAFDSKCIKVVKFDCREKDKKKNYCKLEQTVSAGIKGLNVDEEYFLKSKVEKASKRFLSNIFSLFYSRKIEVKSDTFRLRNVSLKQPTYPSKDTSKWELVGPGGGGRITSVTEDPSNTNNLYITINVGGARKSTDGGKTWRIINKGFAYEEEGENAQRLMDIAVHPNNSNVVLAAGLNGYIYSSTDGGNSWKVGYKHPAKANYDYSQIVFDPVDSNTAYIGVGSIQRLLLGVGARRLQDYWDKITSSPTIIKGKWDGSRWIWEGIGAIEGDTRAKGGKYLNIYSTDVNPKNPKELFFVTERGLYKGSIETDGKIKTFTLITNGLPEPEVIHGGKIVFDRVNSGTAYLTILNLYIKKGQQDVGGVFKSVDGGNTWQELTNGLDIKNSNYFDIQIDPKDSKTIYVAQTTNENREFDGEAFPKIDGTLYKSIDDGNSWRSIIDKPKVQSGWLEIDHFGPDFISVSKYTQTIRWSIGGGMLFQNEIMIEPYTWRNILTREVTDEEWTNVGSEAIALAWSLAIDPKNSDVIYIPYGDHAYFKSDNGGKSVKILTTFRDMKRVGNRGDSGTLIVDEKESGNIYAATQGPHQALQDGGVMYSKDYGKTWQTIGGHLDGEKEPRKYRGLPRAAMTDILVEYDKDKRNLYVASYGNKETEGGVYILEDVESQNEWQKILSMKNIRSLAFRDNFAVLYVGIDDKGLYKLKKQGGKWTAQGPIEVHGSKTFYDMETGILSGDVYIATDKGLFAVDTSDTVRRLREFPSGSRSAVEIHPKNEDIMYLASDKSGIFKSTDRGHTWNLISQDIPTLGFVMLKIDPNNDTIYAEAPGAGIWKRVFTKDILKTNAINLSSTSLDVAPFGINSPVSTKELREYSSYSSLLKDLGIGWISDALFRSRIEATKGVYDWNEPDTLVRTYSDELGLKILFVLNPLTRWDREGLKVENKEEGKEVYLPNTEDGFRAWEQYVAATASRYKGKVAIWMIYNEPSGEYAKRHHASYARLVKTAYHTIKRIDPEVEVSLGGSTSGRGSIKWFDEILELLASDPECPTGCFDLFDYHTYGFADEYEKIFASGPDESATTHSDDFTVILKKHGFGAKSIIIKEGATYSGQDKGATKNQRVLTLQTEADQAAFLVKRAVYRLAVGVRQVHWSTLLEQRPGHQKNPDFSSLTGLMYNGVPTAGSCNPAKVLPCPDPGDGLKKLSYYTYKFLIEKLRGSDFGNVKTIPTGIPNVYLYEFTKEGKPTYIAWWDYFEEGAKEKYVTLTVPSIKTSQGKITEAIPNFNSDFQTQDKRLKETDYPKFFNSFSVPVVNGKITLTLGKKPIYVESIS